MLNKVQIFGFTLVEMLIAVGLVAVLSAGVISLIGRGPGQSGRDARRLADLEKIASGVELYRNDNGTYPPCPAASPNNCQPTAIVGTPVFSAYMSLVPSDTGSRLYVYSPRPVGCLGTTASRCTTYEVCASAERGGATHTCGSSGTTSCGTGGEMCVLWEQSR